jgi:hypothetical protein
MFQGLFGNAAEVDANGLQKDLDALLIEGEQVVREFRRGAYIQGVQKTLAHFILR